jgi:hypothetical protein
MKNLFIIILLLISTFTIKSQTFQEKSIAVVLERDSRNLWLYQSVYIQGEYAFIGSEREYYGDTNTKLGFGVVHVFKNNNGKWNYHQKLTPSHYLGPAFFGQKVSMFGDYAAIGTPSFEHHSYLGGIQTRNSGAVYIFQNIGGYWHEYQFLEASDRDTNDAFGYDVSINGNFMVVSAINEGWKDGFQFSGAIYVFENICGKWTQIQKIISPDRNTTDNFGASVFMSEKFLAVSATGEGNDSNNTNLRPYAGAVYIYEKSGNKWVYSQKIVASDRDSFDAFGYDISISGNYLIVSAPYKDKDLFRRNQAKKDKAGAAYIFENIKGQWCETKKVTATQQAKNDFFGRSVSIYGDYAVVGCSNDDYDVYEKNFLSESGSVHVFHRNNGKWNHIQKICASNREEISYFGWDVNIWEGRLIVGTINEDKNFGPPFPSNYVDDAAYIFENVNYISSIQDETQKKINVFPNPTNGFFSFTIINKEKTDLKITIVNISGETVFSKVVPGDETKFSEKINLENKPKGIYLLKVNSNESIWTEKIILY